MGFLVGLGASTTRSGASIPPEGGACHPVRHASGGNREDQATVDA